MRRGYAVYQLDYAGRAKAANGTVRLAAVVLDEIAIGDIVVKNVPAAVIEEPVDVSLLGLSFLSRLDGFEVKDGLIILRW